ncbi:Tetratricopeptide-like helical [Penicillium macrosclerotiorum]|uniref:Tetratricopeptide-like helical n=1 Tax=Penicillium macrosclerotiorum TaxID=303699 RepID=UPI00254762F6|nr:Tetratricopeptide-like helical [Penicillium macrosclerotiorum]KAJ5688767.1 Tetratricopeptide-like helical [Penicillium macrosclerotiorum]
MSSSTINPIWPGTPPSPFTVGLFSTETILSSPNMSQDPRVLLQKADKALSGASGGFSWFGGRTEKYENASDLYTQAANAFRVQKMTDTVNLSAPVDKEAGQAFEKAAAIQTQNLNEPDDAANTLQEAFKVYRKSDPEDAVRALSSAINHYVLRGNLRRAATQQQYLAELYEVELGDMKKALDAYEKAAEWFEGDNAEALANKHFLKVADLAALEGDYYKSINIYERISRQSITNNLMRWSVKDYFLKGGICHLATKDFVETGRAFESYREIDPTFTSTREHQLLVDLLQAVEAGDQEGFADKLFQFDQLSKLDKWKTTLLLRIKNSIEEAEEDFS